MAELLAIIDYSDSVESLISLRTLILQQKPPNAVSLLAAIAWRQRQIVRSN